MPKTLVEAGDTVEANASRVIQKHFPDLTAAGVTVSYWFANNATGPALRHNGYPAAALVKITSYENRVKGVADATVEIDERHWQAATTDERDALLYHELNHLIPVEETNDDRRAETGKWRTDDLGRPKLRMRKHDWQMGGFWGTIEHYQENAVELQNLAKVNKDLRARDLIQQKFWG